VICDFTENESFMRLLKLLRERILIVTNVSLSTHPKLIRYTFVPLRSSGQLMMRNWPNELSNILEYNLRAKVK